MNDPVHEIGEFDPSTSILFLGSGFSLSATNIMGASPPNGTGLRRHFIKELGLPADTSYDLQILSEEFANSDPTKLRDELYKIFRIKALCPSQNAILNEDWRRIYTTNYDDCVEIGKFSSKNTRPTYDVSESLPNKLAHGSVVHLHGSIRLVTSENLKTSLVLGEASYVNQYVVKSPWYDQFQRDLIFSSALFIVGYSLADYHIAALLLEDPSLAKRTFFVQSVDRDDVFLRRTANYGRTFFIGVDGFADLLKSAPRQQAKTDLAKLRSFKGMNPTRDRGAIAQPTASEVYDLLVYGDFDPSRLARSQPAESYAIARAESITSAVTIIDSNRALVVDGRLGNGKTVFLHLLASELSKTGWNCVLFRPGNSDISHEVAALRNIEKLVIFIEQYSSAQDAIQGLRAALPDAKFVVEIRTGTFEVRYHELAHLLPRPFDRLSLNKLNRAELAALGRLCRHAGLPPPTNTEKRSSDFRDILLELYNNRSIRDRIASSLAPLFDRPATRRILTMIMLIAGHQGSVSAAFVRSVIGVDPFVALKPLEYLTKEIFDVSSDNFKARSVVFSGFVIDSFIESREIADAVIDVTLAAAERKPERAYRILMSNMMAYSSLRRILGGRTDVFGVILHVYERLRHDSRISAEPLFWLQFAIAMTEAAKLDLGWEYIQTAYRKAEELPGFETFQIDTQAFRVALLIASAERAGISIKNIEDIIDGYERIDRMLNEESHRSYAVRVLESVPRFISLRRNDLSSGEKTAVHFWMLKIVNSLGTLPTDFRTSTGSDTVRANLQASANLLL